MGTLHIVSTPIGNLGDITLRAIEVLKSVDLIVCEDTRVCGRLLTHLGVEKAMFALNDFNEASKAPLLVEKLKEGQNLALVSDAGTPLVSDPGYKLVRDSIEAGIKVECAPGPSSVIAALTICGLPPDKFYFLGYLPKKDKKRRDVLDEIKKIKEILKTTVIFFESPFRLLKTLEDVKAVFGDSDIVICRELTKMHEEVRREKVSSAIDHFKTVAPKGELIVLI